MITHQSYKELLEKSDLGIYHCLNDFKILKYLGEGSYCKVYLVQNKQTLDYYAMKIVKAHSIDQEVFESLQK